jgi:hypothetical protein
MSDNNGLVMGIYGVKLTDVELTNLTNNDLQEIAEKIVNELNTREIQGTNVGVKIGDCFIDNAKNHRKTIYVINNIDKRNGFTIIKGEQYTIEYDQLDIIGHAQFSLKSDILSRLDKLEGFDYKLFENGYKDLEKSLLLQWNGYIDNLCEKTGIILKKYEL